jgi:hypothetical protein
MSTFGQSVGYLGGINGLSQPAAGAGSCMLGATQQFIRPKIGGRRTKKAQRKRKQQKQQKQGGGFLPSIGEPFVAAVGKYVAPLALYGIYKFINGSKKTRKSKSKRNRV